MLMALEGLSSTSTPAPTSGTPITAGATPLAAGTPVASSAGSAAGTKAAGEATVAGKPGTAPATEIPADFLQILTGTLVGGPPASSLEAAAMSADKPAGSKNGDGTGDDEIGFEDLSEFLSQVLVPGASVPPSAPIDSDTTVEIDFSNDADDESALSSEMLSALSADARSASKTALPLPQDRSIAAGTTAQTDPIMTLDTSLLQDVLAAEKATAAALDPNGLATGDADNVNSLSFSTLHSASLHAAHAATQASAPTELRNTVGTQAWADELGGHLTWMAQQGRESASLTLSPEHLGPIEVRISVQDGKTSVWFGAVNADTRSAIEEALPRLRDLFSAQGLSLADSGVFREAPRQPQPSLSGASRGHTSADEISGVTSVAKRGNGILDLYA